MRLDVALDGVFEISDRFEDAASDFPTCDRRKEALDCVEPRRRGWCEMECPSRMVGEPRQDIGMFVGRVVVGDGVNDFSSWYGALNGVQESNELLMPMLFHTPPDDGSVEDVERREQCGHAVAFVIVGHGSAFSGFQWQSRLGAIERLNLAFLVDGDDDRVSRRRDVEADDVLDFFSEFWIAGSFESANAMGLQAMSIPQALNRPKRNAERLGHRAARPVGGFARRFRAGQLQHFRDGPGRKRSAPGFARLVAQKSIDALLAISLLPAPDSWATHVSPPSDFQHGQSLGGKQDDPRPLNVLHGTIAIARDSEQSLAVFGAHDDIDGLGHAPDSHIWRIM